MPDFGNAWSKCFDRIKFVRSYWGIFNIKSDKDDPPMTAFDLVPPFSHTRLVCMIAAGGDYSTFERLYYEVDHADVWEAIGLQKAASWTPPPRKEAEEK